MSVYNNVLETIGNTPLIRLNHFSKKLNLNVYAKVEGYNPGHSAKDRIALYMIQRAEKQGKIKPGATIIEASSGNTGFAIAMVCAIKGYHALITVSSKISSEKLNQLRAMGAEVIVCPKSAKPEDPRSYYSQAKQKAREIPNSFYLNQNFNIDNPNAHYHTTGPEIWNQSNGAITHFICTSGTGGTISGTGSYLKEQNPDVQVIGIDAYGSIIKKYHETGMIDETENYSNTLEGVGKSIVPSNVKFDVIDEFIKVTDKGSALRARELAKTEGLLVGYSAGSVLEGLIKLRDRFTVNDYLVLLFSDHGSKYIGKIYDDQWMEEHGFLEPEYCLKEPITI
ncbi:MAG TPA: cysteine synthase family protein [Saprospiraceae bacterium]|nr:cysteine synthase family protein [Saprospiraceae bacterium]